MHETDARQKNDETGGHIQEEVVCSPKIMRYQQW